MRHKIFFFILLLLIIALLVSIFQFSNQDGDDSSALSRQVAAFLSFLINPAYMNSVKETAQNHVISFLIHPVRKLAHFAEYGLLGVLLMCAALCLKMRMGTRMFCSILCAAVCAVVDEFHQTFVTGRAGVPADVLLDTCGACCGVLIVWILSLAILYGMGHKRPRRTGRPRKPRSNHSGYMAAPPPERIR